MAELKPCPFCGESLFITGREKTINLEEIELTTSLYYMFCQKCGARGPLLKSGQAAIDAWNKRSK